jgi:hypothetical protein
MSVWARRIRTGKVYPRNGVWAYRRDVSPGGVRQVSGFAPVRSVIALIEEARVTLA